MTKDFQINNMLSELYTEALQGAITGQLVFRPSSQHPPGVKDDRILTMVFGVVAVPKIFPIDDHVQYPILGHLDDGLKIHLKLNEGTEIDKEYYPLGESISGLMTSPIWRV